MSVNTLLIPTDGSDRAKNAARRGFHLAKALGATVRILSVADSTIAAGAGYSGDSPSIRRRLKEIATRRSNALRDEAIEYGLDATAAVDEGIPSKAIVEHADTHGIDGIVLGTSGRGGIGRAVLGSVADKVIRTASVPVITITPDAAGSVSDIDTVLLPTDGSDAANDVVHFGFELAVQLGATVHLISVVETDRTIRDRDGSEIFEDAAEEVTANLEALADDARKNGVGVHTTVRDGRAAEEILSYAASESVDLIAMGTAGRGGFERLLVGSVTDTVVRNASVPVLTVRPDRNDGDTQ